MNNLKCCLNHGSSYNSRMLGAMILHKQSIERSKITLYISPCLVSIAVATVKLWPPEVGPRYKFSCVKYLLTKWLKTLLLAPPHKYAGPVEAKIPLAPIYEDSYTSLLKLAS